MGKYFLFQVSVINSKVKWDRNWCKENTK